MSVTHTLALDLQRRRAAGEPFDTAWQAAAAFAITQTCDPADWADALNATSNVWRSAYQREPCPRHELACGALNDRTDAIEIEDGRTCIECAQPLPPTAHPSRKACTGCISARRARQNQASKHRHTTIK